MSRYKALLILPFSILSGCDLRPTAVKRCESALLATLKAPSTFKSMNSFVGLPDKSGKQDVFITYDAANTYNTPIRDRFWCSYDARRDAAGPAGDNVETVADNLEALADNLSDAAVTEGPPAPSRPTPPPSPSTLQSGGEEETPVCDLPDSDERRSLMNEIGVDCTPD